MSQLDEKSLGKRLQAMRKRQGFTQQALCQAANLSYSTLAKIERGAIKSPSIFTVQSIAVAIGVSMDELLGMSTPVKYGRSKSGVTFVYFDLNDTLVRAAQQAFTLIAEQTGSLPDVVETTFWHYNDVLCEGSMSVDEFNEVLSKRVGATVDWREAYLQSAEPIAPMQAVLKWASEHYRVGVFSNTLPGLITGLRERGILPDIDYAAIIDSSESGIQKPDTQAYELAREHAGVPAKEILLIDDSRSSVVAAEQLGWHVALFDGYRAEESAERIRTSLELAG
jgi:FMN phosphatase YigB (HAD superfamily)/DNA-binding XRE family transcriptional regulator